MRLKLQQVFWVLLAVSLISSFFFCGKKKPTEPTTEEEPPIDEDVKISLTLQSDKPDSIVISEKIKITFPPGAVNQPTNIQLIELNNQKNASVYSNINPCSPLYILKPHGLQLQKEAELAIDLSKYSPPEGFSFEDLEIVTYDGQNMEALETTVKDNKLVCTITHFSIYFARVKMNAGPSWFGSSKILDTDLYVYKQDGYLCFENIFGDISRHPLKFIADLLSTPANFAVNYKVSLYESLTFGPDKLVYAKQSCRIGWINNLTSYQAKWYPHKIDIDGNTVDDPISYNHFPQNCFIWESITQDYAYHAFVQEVIVEYNSYKVMVGSPRSLPVVDCGYTSGLVNDKMVEYLRTVFMSDEMRKFIPLSELDETKEYSLKVEIDVSDWRLDTSSHYRKSRDFKLSEIPENPGANKPPVIMITSPTQDATYNVGENVQFSATVTDPENQHIPDNDIVWTSDINGEIGRGRNFSLNTLLSGRHHITVVATDPEGLSSFSSVDINIIGVASHSWVRGYLYWADDIPVVNGWVLLMPLAPNQQAVDTNTDENGAFVFTNVASGHYYLLLQLEMGHQHFVTDPPNALEGGSFWVGQNEVVDRDTIILNADLARIIGVVRDSQTGAPINDALIRLIATPGMVVEGVNSNEAGLFYFPMIFEDLPYYLVVSKNGYNELRVPATGTFRVTMGQTKDIGIIQLTPAGSLAAPNLIAPPNGAVINDNTPTFDWSDVDNAQHYQLVIDDNNDFSSPIFNNPYLTTSSYTLDLLRNNSVSYFPFLVGRVLLLEELYAAWLR